MIRGMKGHSWAFVSIFAVSLFYGQSCKEMNDSGLSSESDSPHKVAIRKVDGESNKFTVMISTPGPKPEADPKLCFETDEKCKTNGKVLFKDLKFIRKSEERVVYRYPEEVELPSSDKIFVFVDSKGSLLRKFTTADSDSESDNSGSNVAPEITATKLRADLTHLTQTAWKGRLAGSAGHKEAEKWIIGQLKELGVEEAGTQGYRQPFRPASVRPFNSQGPIANSLPQNYPETSNIVAIFPGTDPKLKDEIILIGAHMDHAGQRTDTTPNGARLIQDNSGQIIGFTCSKGAAGSDNICNGADDNGSGATGLLNITKSLNKIKSTLKRTVVVMWFSAEEEGLMGSYHFVNNPTPKVGNLSRIKLMINLDMIGYLSSQENGTLLVLGQNINDPAYKMAEKIIKKHGVKHKVSPKYRDGGSDHAPFLLKGIPALFFHTGVSNNPNYHKTSDTVEKIDFSGMEKISKIAFDTVITAANSDKPGGLQLVSENSGPLISDEEAGKSCHHLIRLDITRMKQVDFRESNQLD